MNTYVILKRSKDGWNAILANKEARRPRKFNGQRKALNFVENMIRVATRQKLTKEDFNLVKVNTGEFKTHTL